MAETTLRNPAAVANPTKTKTPPLLSTIPDTVGPMSLPLPATRPQVEPKVVNEITPQLEQAIQGVKPQDITSFGMTEDEPDAVTKVAQIEPDIAPPPETQVHNAAAQTAAAKARATGGDSSSGVAGEKKLRNSAGVSRYPTIDESIKHLQNNRQSLAALSSKNQDWFEERINAVTTQTQEYMRRLEAEKDAARDEKSKTDIYLALGQAAELIGHNITRLYAANYGLRKGVDLSGLKFDKFDWASTQARFDKRFENTLNSIDDRTEKTITADATKQKELTQQAGEINKALIQADEKAQEKIADLSITKERLEQGDRRMEQDKELQERRLELELLKINAMKERNDVAKALQEAGKEDKAAAMLAKNNQAAVNMLKTAIVAQVGTEGESLSQTEIKAIVDQSATKLAGSGVDIYKLLKPLSSKGFLGIGAGKVNKQALLTELEKIESATPTNTGGNESQAAVSSPEVIHGGSEPEAYSIPDVE